MKGRSNILISSGITLFVLLVVAFTLSDGHANHASAYVNNVLMFR